MNRLWVRLSLAFSVIVFISFAVIIAANLLIIRAEFAALDPVSRIRAEDGLLDQLEDHYATVGTWEGADLLLRGAGVLLRSERNADVRIALISHDGRTVAGDDTLRRDVERAWREDIRPPRDDRPDNEGRPAQSPDRNPGPNFDDRRRPGPLPVRLDIIVEGEPVGQLLVATNRNEPPTGRPLMAFFWPLGLEATVVVMGVVGVVGGLGFGVLVSRWLTGPLDKLMQAATVLAGANYDSRVDVEGTVEIARLATAFNDMAAALQRGEQLRRNMVADVAHELRTPLTTIQSNLYALMDDVYPLTKAEIVRLYDQTQLLNRLVADLHQLAQADARQLPIHLTPTDLRDPVGEVVESYQAVAEARGLRLVYDPPSSLPEVNADPPRLQQVIQNLLGNAVRHTPEGGCITVRLAQLNEDVCLSVEDTGSGIPPEHLPNIFERFYRVDGSRSREGGGSGLGLAISRALVEAHSGTITAHSPAADERGTRFNVLLPVMKP